MHPESKLGNNSRVRSCNLQRLQKSITEEDCIFEHKASDQAFAMRSYYTNGLNRTKLKSHVYIWSRTLLIVYFPIDKKGQRDVPYMGGESVADSFVFGESERSANECRANRIGSGRATSTRPITNHSRGTIKQNRGKKIPVKSIAFHMHLARPPRNSR